MNEQAKISVVLPTLAVVFCALIVAFGRHWRVAADPSSRIALVDPSLIIPATFRTSYVQLIQMKADLSDFDCYACHDKAKPPTLRFDTNNTIIVPPEHPEVVMAHGGHGRNNNCYNCHDEHNLLMFSTRDGRELKLEDSPQLCGSCHGPTYRDWEVGAHGRISGYWDVSLGAPRRQICVDCHNPHSPAIPSIKPLPRPHPLRRMAEVKEE